MSFPAVRLTLAVAVLVLLVGVALIRLRRVRRAASAREGLTQFLGACAGRYPELLLRQVYASSRRTSALRS